MQRNNYPSRAPSYPTTEYRRENSRYPSQKEYLSNRTERLEESKKLDYTPKRKEITQEDFLSGKEKSKYTEKRDSEESKYPHEEKEPDCLKKDDNAKEDSLERIANRKSKNNDETIHSTRERGGLSMKDILRGGLEKATRSG